MDSKKSIIKLMDDFSKKISSSNEAQNISLKTSHSSIQQKINDQESEISIQTQKKIDGKDFYKNFTLSFIEKELWKPSAFEKEIIQAASECFTDKLKNFL